MQHHGGVPTYATEGRRCPPAVSLPRGSRDESDVPASSDVQKVGFPGRVIWRIKVASYPCGSARHVGNKHGR